MALDQVEKWIGVDLDGTLADTRTAPIAKYMIPSPVPAMVDRVKVWLKYGITVKVFTARMSSSPELWQLRIGNWTEQFIGTRLEATCCKDYGCIAIWDDIAIGVYPNTGISRTTRPDE